MLTAMMYLLAPFVVFAVWFIMETIYDRLGSHLMFVSVKNEIICSCLVAAVLVVFILFARYVMEGGITGGIEPVGRYGSRVALGIIGVGVFFTVIIYKSMHMDFIKHFVDYDVCIFISSISAAIIYLII